jgi:hypothetical protein
MIPKVDVATETGNVQEIVERQYEEYRKHLPREEIYTNGEGEDDFGYDSGKGIFDDGQVDDASGEPLVHIKFYTGGVGEDQDDDDGGLIEIMFQGLLPDMADGYAELRLTEVIIRVRGLQTATNNQQLEITEKQRQKLREQMIASLKASSDKVDAAAAKTKDDDIWTKVKLGIEWLGAALGVAVGGALMWFGGAGLGLCLICIGVISLLAAADSTTSIFSEAKMGIAAHMWVALGVDKETAEALQTAASIIAAVVATAIAIALFWVPGDELATIAQWIQIGSTLTTSGMELMKVVGDLTVGGIKYDAEMLRVKAKELQADSKEFEANLLPLDALIEQVLEQIASASINEGWNAMLEAVLAAIKIRIDAVARAPV